MADTLSAMGQVKMRLLGVFLFVHTKRHTKNDALLGSTVVPFACGRT